MLRHARNFSSTSKHLQGKLLPPIISRDQLSKFIRNPSWRVHDVIPSTSSTTKRVDSRVVRKMLKLSGLNTDISEHEESQWIRALNTQVAFIDHLVEDESEHKPQANGSEIFRLIASDHNPPPPLTLTKLLEDVANVENEIDPKKGEFGFDTAGLRTVVHEKKQTHKDISRFQS